MKHNTEICKQTSNDAAEETYIEIDLLDNQDPLIERWRETSRHQTYKLKPCNCIFNFVHFMISIAFTETSQTSRLKDLNVGPRVM